MKSSLGGFALGASSSGSRSEICSLKNCVGLQLRDEDGILSECSFVCVADSLKDRLHLGQV